MITGRARNGARPVCKQDNMDYQETVSFLEQIPRFRGGDALAPTKELLGALGDPQEKAPYIHVAGTNGKGTVCAVMAKVLEEAGLKVGLFTSPHLVRINERIRINGRSISDEDFVRAFEAVMAGENLLREKDLPLPPYFGMLYAMAMWYFDREKVDCIIAETGLGGRLDQTNLVREPALCVITSIGLDHTQYLGDTVEKIAGEKAGIIKPGVPVVFDGTSPEAAGVIRKTAKEQSSPAVMVERSMIREAHRTDKGIAFILNNRYYDNTPVEIPSPAMYQADNFALALTALRVLDPEGIFYTPGSAAAAAGRVKWPGRMQSAGPSLMVDGAHNPPAVKALCEWISYEEKKQPLTLLVGVASDKDTASIVKMLAGAASWRAVVVTGIGSDRGLECSELKKLFEEQTASPVYAEEDLSGALALAREKAGGGMVLAAGSLYLAGSVLAMEGQETDIL